MSKTSDVIELLESGENDTTKIKEQTGASESLITRCRNRLEKQKYKVPKQEEAKEEEEEEPTDEEIDGIITKIKVKPEEKYLTKEKQVKEENYRCTGCGHRWKASEMPVFCPGCGAEF